MEMDRAHFKETAGTIEKKEMTTKENLEKDNRRGNNRDGKGLERG
jgi:hypothetical protein